MVHNAHDGSALRIGDGVTRGVGMHHCPLPFAPPESAPDAHRMNTTLAVGSKVQLVGLQQRPELNGKRLVLRAIGADGRLECTGAQARVRVRLCNVVHRHTSVDVAELLYEAFASLDLDAPLEVPAQAADGALLYPRSGRRVDCAAVGPAVGPPDGALERRFGWTTERAGDQIVFVGWEPAPLAPARMFGVHQLESGELKLGATLERVDGVWTARPATCALRWMCDRMDAQMSADDDSDEGGAVSDDHDATTSDGDDDTTTSDVDVDDDAATSDVGDGSPPTVGVRLRSPLDAPTCAPEPRTSSVA